MRNIADIISRVIEDTHVPMVEKVFGKDGLDAVFQIMDTVKMLYQHVDPERISGQVIVFKVVSPALQGTPSTIGPAADFACLANDVVSDLCFEIASDGRPYVYKLGAVTLETLAKTAVVYYYKGTDEEFLAGSECKLVPRLDQSARSQFSVPTFSDLRDALQRYAIENVRESSCYIFRNVWYDENRIFLKGGPESLMRNSLKQFLNNRLGGDHDVWPEQNVNEKNPVDIRVQPRYSSNRLMLIEIKWLGDSVAEDGHRTAQHRELRAQKGADQLAEYLDEQRRSAPTRVIHGYYVIFDARRENVPNHASAIRTISRENGLYYENRDLDFDPAPHQTRADFDPPYRMFARPVCCD